MFGTIYRETILTSHPADPAVLEDLGGQGNSQAENDGEGRERCD
jgi:hypothetical protein